MFDKWWLLCFISGILNWLTSGSLILGWLGLWPWIAAHVAAVAIVAAATSASASSDSATGKPRASLPSSYSEKDALAAAIAAVAGTRLGTWLLVRWDDQRFQRVGGQIILATGTICILQGSYQLMRSAGFMA